MVWKGDAARGLGGGRGPASPLPSLRVCGAWESPDCPICKLQSRLSASTSEIKDPSSCLVPSEPGLSSVQTLWHHGADCWGNLLLGWEKRGRLRQFSVKERKKQKERREHTTTKTVYSSRVAGGNPGTAEMLPVLGQGASYWEGLSLCFSSTAIWYWEFLMENPVRSPEVVDWQLQDAENPWGCSCFAAPAARAELTRVQHRDDRAWR